MITEEKAREYAENRLRTKYPNTSPSRHKAVALFDTYDMEQAYEDGATEALASQWKDPKVELPEDDTMVIAHSPNGRIDVLTFHDGVFIDELGQAHCVDYWLLIPPLKGDPDTFDETDK